MSTLRGRWALVTGATSGFGEAIAHALARAGASVAITGRREHRLANVAEEIRSRHQVSVSPLVFDVRDRAAVSHALSREEKLLSHLEVVVNNAGLALALDPVSTGDPDDWDQMIDTNVKGLLYMTRAVVPHMVARNSGHVINIGSIAGHWTYPKGAVYNATKAGVRSITEGLNMDLLGTSVRVSSVDPGMAETEFSDVRFDGDGGRAKDVYKGVKPLSAEDVADVILYVANLPEHVNILDVVMMPTAQRSATLVHREGT